MYSMNYIGKFIANFREFYNEINAATLTGAIDVVVVEQPDGSFTCSPFHVRFGKLGVLRSRFKMVDLELNGEPLSIHMKLGESGEAFFVEEVPEDDTDWSAHLATSPIPDTRFEDLYPPRRRNSVSEMCDRSENQISDYSQRRYTDSAMEKPSFSKASKEYSSHKEEETNAESHEALFEMEGLDDAPTNVSTSTANVASSTANVATSTANVATSTVNVATSTVNVATSTANVAAPKTFVATRVGEEKSAANETVRKISVHNDFRPIEEETPGNGKKKKKTKKAGSKKKHHRKSSSSSNSSQSEHAGSEPRQTPASSGQSIAAPSADINFFSDSELVPAVIRESDRRDTSVLSDTEAELSRNNTSGDKGQSWRWGELPEPPPRGANAANSPSDCASPVEPLSSDEGRSMLGNMFGFMKSREGVPSGGVYLDELADGQVDPELYLSTHHTHVQRNELAAGVGGGASEEEYESGNGPSLPQSPASLDPPHMDSDDDDKLLSKGYIGVYVREETGGAAVSRAVSFDEFASSPSELLASSRLQVRIGDQYLPWSAAGPALLSLLAYKRHLPRRVLESLSTTGDAAMRQDETATKSRGYSWWSWRRSNPPQHHDTATKIQEKPVEEAKPVKVGEEATPAEETKSIEEPCNQEAADQTIRERECETQAESETQGKDEKELDTAEERTEVDAVEENSVEESATLPTTGGVEQLPRDASEAETPAPRMYSRHSRHRQSTDRFRKTLRLSSDQIASLNLKEGINEMVFSVTTAYQGTTRCKCNVFRWRHDDKIVISDIDGTITKSDVLGHIFPLVGKDWAQSGVAQLFTKISNNGYKLLYLSARAIGQARVTREYLRSIRQGEVSLPDGPLLLNPTSLLRAFHREVIEKKPEEFKIQCLADIKALFPHQSNPFYAGYGNRVNDVCAYQAVGIPIVRIFTINYRGELKHELTQTFQSTYSHMSVLVDQVFPPCLLEPCDDFSQAVYWREPLPSLDLSLPPVPEIGH